MPMLLGIVCVPSGRNETKMNIKHIRNFFLIFVITLMFYASYIIVFNDIALKNETVSKSLIIGENEKITELKLGISEYDTFDPILTKNKDIQYISKLVYDSLFTIKEDYSIKNCLAIECSQISDTSYIIKLREDAYWSNGEKFGAQDVIYTIEKIRKEESIYKHLIEPIESIQIIDEYTIKINLYKKTTFFEYNLIFPIIKNNSGEEFYNIGMYNIKTIEEDKIILIKNDKWYNKESSEPIFENVTIYLYPNKTDEYKAFKKSEIDIIHTNNINYEEYIGKYGYNEKKYLCPNHTILAFNMENEFLSNINIRQAISYAIDKHNITDIIFNNKYEPSDFPLDYGNFLYTENLYEHIYNPKYANEILNKQFENFVINLNLIVKDTETEKIKVAENIKSDLENIGIMVNIQILEEEKFKKNIDNKNYDLLLCTVDLSLNPSLETFLGKDNLFNYNNLDVIEILGQISNIKDEEVLIQKFKELQKYYFEDIPCISLYNEGNMVLYSKNLRAILSPNYYNLFYGIERWYLVRNFNYLG